MRQFILSTLLAAAFATGAAAQANQPPIVFVHGNGDDATKWVPVIWLFESNGYPTDRLFAIRFTDPAARREDHKFEEFRSSTTDQASELAGFVARVLLETKVRKVVLVGSSRGGLTIRNYIRNAGGAAVVSDAILCGTPNHGVTVMDPAIDNEFNARGPFLRELNAGSEAVEGVRFMTIRSDKLDKYAQPGVGYEGPELKGAENVVIPGLDHRETAFHPLAFEKMYRFVTGRAPESTRPVSIASPTVSGLITGFAGATPTNCPLAGVHVRVFALKPGSAERDGDAVLDLTTSGTGAWGPVSVKPDRTYEFVLQRDGRSVTYFMSGLIRSTALLNFRFAPPTAFQMEGAPAPRLVIYRPQGYLAKGRDLLLLDGAPVETLAPGVPTRDAVTVAIPASKASGVRVALRDELVHARPATAENELNVVEFLRD